MTTAPKPTTLSVRDAETGSWIYQMGDQDIADIPFDAGENISAATVTLSEYRTQIVITPPPSMTFDNTGEAVVRVSGLTRGLFYELAVTFTDPDGDKWTRTLFIECVT